MSSHLPVVTTLQSKLDEINEQRNHWLAQSDECILKSNRIMAVANALKMLGEEVATELQSASVSVNRPVIDAPPVEVSALSLGFATAMRTYNTVRRSRGEAVVTDPLKYLNSSKKWQGLVTPDEVQELAVELLVPSTVRGRRPNETRCEKLDDLQERHDDLQERHDDLQERYDDLLKKYRKTLH